MTRYLQRKVSRSNSINSKGIERRWGAARASCGRRFSPEILARFFFAKGNENPEKVGPVVLPQWLNTTQSLITHGNCAAARGFIHSGRGSAGRRVEAPSHSYVVFLFSWARFIQYDRGSRVGMFGFKKMYNRSRLAGFIQSDRGSTGRWPIQFEHKPSLFLN